MKSSGLSAVRLFTAIDQTNDGYVSRREIRTAVNTLLKDSVKVSDIDAMLDTFDANGDGVISLDEFLTVMEKHQPKQFVPVLPDLKPPPK
jgi:Ca2+-binding EF-hand superfamily protein